MNWRLTGLASAGGKLSAWPALFPALPVFVPPARLANKTRKLIANSCRVEFSLNFEATATCKFLIANRRRSRDFPGRKSAMLAYSKFSGDRCRDCAKLMAVFLQERPFLA